MLAGIVGAVVMGGVPVVRVCAQPIRTPPRAVSPLPDEGTIMPYGFGDQAEVRRIVDGRAGSRQSETLK